jgi:hypothetical protein
MNRIIKDKGRSRGEICTMKRCSFGAQDERSGGEVEIIDVSLFSQGWMLT